MANQTLYKYKRMDTLISIIFSLIFIGAILFVSYVNTNTSWIKVVNWQEIAPLFILSLSFGLSNYVVRLIKEDICTMNTILTIAISVVQMILAYVIIKQLNFWNVAYLYNGLNLKAVSISLSEIITIIENSLLAIIIGINIIVILHAGFRQYTLNHSLS